MRAFLCPVAEVLQLRGDKISDPSLTVQEAKAIIARLFQLKAGWERAFNDANSKFVAPQNHGRSESLLQSPATIL